MSGSESRTRREGLIEAVIRTQLEVAHALQAGSTSWLDIDLTMAQLKTLFVLADAGPSAIGEVGALLGVGLPTASHLVDRLVRTGLASRVEDPSDRRRTLASVTPEGQELLRGLREGGRERYRAVLRWLDDDDLQALRQGLAALAEAVREAEPGEKPVQSSGAATAQRRDQG